jgi:hypothetical protein
MHTVCILHVSATHVAIFREVRYKGQTHRNVTGLSGTSAQIEWSSLQLILTHPCLDGGLLTCVLFVTHQNQSQIFLSVF